MSCNGQTQHPFEKTLATGHTKLKRTQGTNEYANIYCGIKDKNGNLWFGTSGEGVYRYDGKLFTQFTRNEGLCSNNVLSILEDKAGNILIGTDSGLCQYNTYQVISKLPLTINNNFNFYSSTPSKEFPVSKNAIWSMMEDKDGKLWIGTEQGVFYCNKPHANDGKNLMFKRFLIGDGVINKNGLQLKMVDCILQGKNGDMWFCSGMPPGMEGLCRYFKDSTQTAKSIVNYKPNGSGWIRKIIETKDGRLCVASRHFGVCFFDGKVFRNFTEQAGIENLDVTTILEDRSGKIWIATEHGSGQLGEDGGVWCYDPQTKSFQKFTTKEGLIHNGVACIVEDGEGNIWFGTRNIGLCRYAKKSFVSFSE